MLIDSHCHLDRLDLEAFDGQLDGALSHAREQGVKHMLCVCISMDKFQDVLSIAEQHDDISCSVGVHPLYDGVKDTDVEDLVTKAQHPKVVAIGETGLDYFYNKEPENHILQQQSFRKHIQAANQANLPIIVHTRDAREDTITILKEENAEKCGGVLHCFTESLEMAEAAMELGFYISFSGIVTFKNAEELRDVCRKVPLDKILIETDSPYLAPVPHRGKSNLPGYVKDVGQFVADLHGLSYQELCEITSTNYQRLFSKSKVS
ncbi:TatD family hydrolase [Kangiella spongicola]|uniref:Hydrolase TatD n=1 Tax=Kangiella spongicola TaxID=796379 RepID=A0A318D0J1_9GAMM|nr:TatD family hydrolase [Kangiella spongicola]PXF62740.1 hydrolase TatD [Kangiella spongicola]